MKKIIVFAGSTSKTSINKQLASYASSLLDNVTSEVLDLNDFEVPMYSVDFETENEYPNGATKFNKKLDQADAFIVSLAEHNGSYAAAYKNLFDWASRKEKNVFRNKPVLLLATSPGGRGGASVLQTATLTYPHMGAEVIASISLGNFYDNFKDNKVIDEDFNNKLNSALKELKAKLN